jgi:proteasome lid subunit RPN8/RPN11
MNAVQVADMPPAAQPRPSPPVRLIISHASLAATQEALRNESASEREALVLWAGRTVDSDLAVVCHLIVPACVASEDVLVVPHGERVDVSQFVRAQGLLVFADLHTHPQAAFLSLADRARPFSVRRGFYALVVPDFARREPLDGWRMYEETGGEWEEVCLDERICIDTF